MVADKTVVAPASRASSKASASSKGSDAPLMIGKYKIIGEIARGGMGVVYKSHHPKLDRDIVIKKMLSRGNREEKERFNREAKILYDMQSPYIVKFLDTFDDARYQYIVEEFVDGIALDKLLDRQIKSGAAPKLPVQVSLLILRDVCFALEFAHFRSVIHRDIKPGNVLISKRAEIKLTDFGIGRVKTEKEGECSPQDGVTQSGAMLGTPAYMPPEQFNDSSSVDQRADIYALGVMLYVMVTGTKPYPGNLTPATLELIKKGKYTPPQKIDNTLPKVVCRLIKKMMKPNAASRFQSVRPIIKACQKYLKHYDTHDIRVEIARATLSKGAYNFKTFIPKDVHLKKALTIVFSCAVLSAVFTYLWREGYIHRTILRQLYTPVDVRVQLPAYKWSDLPAKAFFFLDEKRSGQSDAGPKTVIGDGFPEVKTGRRDFTLMKGRVPPQNSIVDENTKYCTYSIKSVFLRHGDYRVKIAVGPYVWWKSFNVGNNGVLLECSFFKEMRRRLHVSPYAYDASTGQDITKKCRFTVLQGSKWRSLDAADKSRDMLSGQVWKIKVSCNGYQDEIFSLLVDWYQDELYISSSMIKK